MCSPVIRPLMRRTAPRSIESQSILDVMVAWPVARMPESQTGRHPQSAEMQLKPDVESIAIGETGGSGVDLVDRVDQGEPGDNWRASAKLELRFIDVQRLDAMVKRGWWNSELRRSP